MQKNTPNKDDLLRPQHEIVMKPEQFAADKPSEESPPSPIYHKLDFTSNAPKAPVRTTTSQEDTPKSSSSPSAATQKPSPYIPPLMAKVNEDIDTSYWENSQYYEGESV